MPTILQALATAIQHHQTGRLQAAEQIYRRILTVDPDHADAIHLLGVIASQTGKLDLAVETIRRAIALKGGEPAFHVNLGNALMAQGNLEEAVACYRRALELKPDFAGAHNNLGNALKNQGKLDDAIASYRRVLELDPNFAGIHNNLGAAFKAQGKPDEAGAYWRRELELNPNFAEAHNNLGTVLREQGKLDEAIACYRRALELKPDLAEAHNNLGNALKDQGKVSEAIACFRRAVELTPSHAEIPNNLGNALKDRGKLDEAAACYRRALELDPDFAEALSNLGVVFKDQGRLDEAVACSRRALELRPDLAAAHSNLVYAQIFHPDYDAQTLYEEHRRWNQQHAAPLAEFIGPHGNDRAADRRLKIGYVSPDFRDHVVGRNLLPLFRQHDHQRFEIVCYADVPRHDAFTERFRGHSDVWRDTAALSDAQLAQCIRGDGIDILVDLTLHMARNRLLVFARKPAPVQVTFAGYPGTTGLDAIDYRITDRHLDPPGLFDHCYSEETIRLPDSFWCYDPLECDAAVNDLPAVAKGHVTFGCLNNFCKVNPLVLKLWARVLKTVARSRLVILADEGSHRRRTLDVLAEEGVPSDRVEFVAHQPRPRYLTYYHGIDIGLDTVPYNGHTTSLDSFWMGVPVVTLVGQTVVGRAGLGQLMNLGLPELIAASPEQHVRIAAELAGDLPRLADLRATLRQRLRASPLMDAPRFARNVEAAYRQMWRRWR